MRFSLYYPIIKRYHKSCLRQITVINWSLFGSDYYCHYCRKYIKESDSIVIRIRAMDSSSDIIQVLPTVIHSRVADNFVIHIQPCLAAAGQHGIVTSMKREEADQYRIIYQYGISRCVFKASDCTLGEFPARPYQHEGQATFFWIWVWSMLLEAGLLIAPPVGPTAILLGKRRGQIRNPSTHIRGLALDFKGTAVAPTIEGAVKASPEIAALVERVLVERENDATHIDLKDVAV